MPEITAFKRWMSTWRGIGDIVVGMERQGYALSLRKLVDDGWNAAFEEHRLARAGWERERRRHSTRCSVPHGRR